MAGLSGNAARRMSKLHWQRKPLWGAMTKQFKGTLALRNILGIPPQDVECEFTCFLGSGILTIDGDERDCDYGRWIGKWSGNLGSVQKKHAIKNVYGCSIYESYLFLDSRNYVLYSSHSSNVDCIFTFN